MRWSEKASFLDISPRLSEHTAVFPGDTPLKRDVLLDFKTGHNLLLSSLTLSVHLGAHADAPNHYSAGGEGVDTRDLRHYLGAAQVVEVKIPRGERILPEHVAGGVKSLRAPRILFRTGSFPNSDEWNGDFNSLSPELIEALAAQGVCTVGIDTPSIDPSNDTQLHTHQAVAKNDMAVLEGLVLDGALTNCVYTLVALPLKIQGADASPVRAILLPEGALR